MAAEAFFLRADDGHRFCLFHASHLQLVRGSMLFVHPFAEEMNKARRMVALQARQLAEAGFDVLQIDLHGCGDSSGDFGDASWAGWVDDIRMACEWLAQRSTAALWLWGLRAGCLLATYAARRLDIACNFLFWQPSANGQLVVRQFLRMKMANELAGGNTKGAMSAMQLSLAQGEAVEVAGYKLSPKLVLGLEHATLQPPANGARLEWLELAAHAGAALSMAGTTTQARWREAHCSARCTVVDGPAFWQSTEIEVAPQLLSATMTAICEPASA